MAQAMRVIVTGTRHPFQFWIMWAELEYVLANFGPFTLVHGDCPTGADHYASVWAKGRADEGVVEEKFEANWNGEGRAAGPFRNQRMVAAGADLVLAFPTVDSRGTRHTMRLAREAGIEVREHLVWATPTAPRVPRPSGL